MALARVANEEQICSHAVFWVGRVVLGGSIPIPIPFPYFVFQELQDSGWVFWGEGEVLAGEAQLGVSVLLTSVKLIERQFNGPSQT